MKEIIINSGMSLKEFAEYYEIPYNTVRQWYNGTSNPPSYLTKLLKENREIKAKGKQMTIEDSLNLKIKGIETNYNWNTPNYIVQWKSADGEHMYGYTKFTDVIKILNTFNDKTQWRLLDIKCELHEVQNKKEIKILTN